MTETVKNTETARTAESAENVETTENAEPAAPIVKARLHKQRACNEKNEKGKLCMGHLKRWYEISSDPRQEFDPDAELYRCEKCHMIYTPDANDLPRSYTLRY